MKIEEKIKNKYLYSKKTNIFKFFYFYFQFLKAKFKPRLAYSHWGIDLIITKLLASKNRGMDITKIYDERYSKPDGLLSFRASSDEKDVEVSKRIN